MRKLGNNMMVGERLDTISLGDRIVTVRTPGVATAYSFQAEPATAQGTVFLYGFGHILRTGWRVAAGIGQKR